MDKWKKLDSKIVFKHPRITIAEDKVRLPSGKVTDYLIYESYKDFPTIIAINNEGKLLVVEEPAYPVNELLLQFPEGVPENDESLEAAARRELLEETGFSASSLELVASNLHEHRRTTARQYIFVATDLTDTGKTKLDDEEAGIKIHWKTESEIWDLIKSGKIIQKNALAAWANYQASKIPS